MKKLTIFQSLLWIFSSAVVLNLLTYGGIKGYQFWKIRKSIDFNIPIRAIVQTGPQKEALKTNYLAELLDLSVNRPIKSKEFDLKAATAKLLKSPVIKEAEAKMHEPGILYIDYTTRQPVCFLGDFENTALDLEGYPFPINPFFTPKKLPEVYLGIDGDMEWGKQVCGEKINLAFELLKILSSPIICDFFNVKRIDVSNAFEQSYGRREIVLLSQDEIYLNSEDREVCFIFPRILRFSTNKYPQELSNYLKLREELLEKEKLTLKIPQEGGKVIHCPQKTIDFRIPQLAFIED